MAWITRWSRFGDVHLVFGQEHEASCGLACGLMCASKINRWGGGIGKFASEKAAMDLYNDVNRSKTDFVANMATVDSLVKFMNKLHCGIWTFSEGSGQSLSAKLIELVGVNKFIGQSPLIVSVNPVIVAVRYDQTNAGHAVVVDTIRKSPLFERMVATVCDPKDADVHMQEVAADTDLMYRKMDSLPAKSFALIHRV